MKYEKWMIYELIIEKLKQILQAALNYENILETP